MGGVRGTWFRHFRIHSQIVVVGQVKRLVPGVAVQAEVEEEVVTRRDTFDRLSGLNFEGSEG